MDKYDELTGWSSDSGQIKDTCTSISRDRPRTSSHGGHSVSKSSPETSGARIQNSPGSKSCDSGFFHEEDGKSTADPRVNAQGDALRPANPHPLLHRTDERNAPGDDSDCDSPRSGRRTTSTYFDALFSPSLDVVLGHQKPKDRHPVLTRYQRPTYRSFDVDDWKASPGEARHVLVERPTSAFEELLEWGEEREAWRDSGVSAESQEDFPDKATKGSASDTAGRTTLRTDAAQPPLPYQSNQANTIGSLNLHMRDLAMAMISLYGSDTFVDVESCQAQLQEELLR